MLAEIFQQCKDQWIRSKHQKKHPFRTLTLATVNAAGVPQMRTVVLRDFDAQKMHFVVYTDDRSGKAKDLLLQPQAQLLFYDPKKLWQIQVDASCIRRSSDPKVYQQIPARSQKDYTTILAPGTPIDNPEDVDYTAENPHFLQLTFEAQRIESLKLKRPVHVRSQFTREAGEWRFQFLNP